MYRRHVGQIVNKIKHDHARLRFILYSGNSIYFPGYFLEGIDSEGVLGPDQNVHHKGGTAFSFARDLRLHFVEVYAVSRFLSKAIKGIAMPVDTIPADAACAWAEEIATHLGNLSKIYYPDEIRKFNPWIDIRPLEHVEKD